MNGGTIVRHAWEDSTESVSGPNEHEDGQVLDLTGRMPNVTAVVHVAPSVCFLLS